MSEPEATAGPEPADDAILSRAELEALRREAPQRLFRHLQEVQREFLFGVEVERGHPDHWGGEVRLLLNRNVVVHFVPRFGEDMPDLASLPQFTVFPSDDRADAVDDTTLVLDDGEEVQGAVFYVDSSDYDRYLAEAQAVAERYGELDVIPDTYFLETELIAFLHRTVLEHPAVRAERRFDWKRGLVGGAAPPPVEDEEVLSAEELVGMAPGADALDEEDPEEDDEGEHFRTFSL